MKPFLIRLARVSVLPQDEMDFLRIQIFAISLLLEVISEQKIPQMIGCLTKMLAQ
jgi:hypothetical protein